MTQIAVITTMIATASAATANSDLYNGLPPSKVSPSRS